MNSPPPPSPSPSPIIIKSNLTYFLDLPPSCLAFVPLSRCHFVVGTYSLQSLSSGDQGSSATEGGEEEEEERVQKRRGSLSLYFLGDDGMYLFSPVLALSKTGAQVIDVSYFRSLLLTISTPFAILDLCFCDSAPDVLAVATSVGDVYFYSCKLEIGGSESCLREISVFHLADPTVLVLALAWSILPARPSTIAVSLSTGQVGIFDYLIPDAPARFVPAHSLEAWTIAWSKMTASDGSPYVYSGGDDSALVVHDARDLLHLGTTEKEPSTDIVYEPISRDIRTHGAGVTAILPLMVDSIRDQEVLLTGSYDEFLRVLRPKSPSMKAVILAERRLGGGVWRLKQLGASQTMSAGGKTFSILASCMHAGAKIVEVSCSAQENWSIEVLSSFEEHESMNYASDVQDGNNDGLHRKTIISSGFYDKRLCVWNTKDESEGSHMLDNNLKK